MERRCLDLRAKGWKQWKIAEHLGVTQGAVSKALTRGMQRRIEECAEDADHVRELELERLDDLYRAHALLSVGKVEDDDGNVMVAMDSSGRPLGPDARSAAIVLRIQERRASLLGLDAPRRS